mgnify:CR=1 FL=1
MYAFRAQFDYQDIDTVELIKLINEKALQTDNNYIKKAYKYEYLLQINLTTVNGLTLKKEDESLPRQIIANIFMKVRFRE